jgi:hypothetical protein
MYVPKVSDMTTLVKQILGVHQMLDASRVAHAFGGALALAFHVGEPRATRDIDVNVFLPPQSVDKIEQALAKHVTFSNEQRDAARADGQVRVFWGETPIDIFFSTHKFHDDAMRYVEKHDFAGTSIPVLGADHLAVFKAFYNRTKDWADIEEMVSVDALDHPRVVGWLLQLLGPDDERVRRFLSL